MTLEFIAEPAGCPAALTSGLQALAAAPTPGSLSHLAVAANAKAPPPLPVYLLSLNDLATGNASNSGTLVAWNSCSSLEISQSSRPKSILIRPTH